jgi:hypothetical protein
VSGLSSVRNIDLPERAHCLSGEVSPSRLRREIPPAGSLMNNRILQLALAALSLVFVVTTLNDANEA